ncbi:importin-9-like [Clavelina lepadiformis]|uniref:importin-9-like n=1 Tax=Clavelina lepadiformis TaxID=159417 RepID=UPI004042970E
MLSPQAEVDESNLKACLHEVLLAALSSDQNVRNAAEQQIKVYEVMEDFGVCLAEVTVDTSSDFAIRQLASIILKQYVEVHWSKLADKFVLPETTDLAKAAIRQMLPLGLRDNDKKIRGTVAYAISAIAHWDWPDEWPELFPLLMEAVNSGEPDAVHGSMRVLAECSRELSDVNITKVAPILLPELFKIFLQSNTHGIRTRSQAAEIFNTCVCLIHDTDNTGVISSLLPAQFVSEFTLAFANALQVPNGPISDCGLKREVLKTLVNMMRNMPAMMGDAIPVVLSAVWQQLTEGAEYYISSEVNGSVDAGPQVDTDGESISFGNLAYSIFDFVESLLDTNKSKKVVKKSLSELVYYLIMYMQMTEEQMYSWIESPDQFVEDEDEESFSFSVRISAQDLFLSCCREFKKESSIAIMSAVHRHLQESEEKKIKGDVYWWKIHESCFLALGSVRNLVLKSLERSVIQFDFNSFLSTVVLEDLKAPPFLAGRSLWIASRFATLMSHDTLQKYLEATTHGLKPDQSAVIRISSVRAVFAYCDHLNNTALTALLTPFVPSLLEGLLHFVAQATVEVLSLILETLRVVLSINTEITTNYREKIISLAIAVVLKYSHDPLVSSLAGDLLTELASHGTCTAQLEAKLLPTIVSIFNAPIEKVAPGLVSMAMDILCNIIRKLEAPLSVAFIETAFPSMIRCAVNSDDNSILQSAGECTRAYISTATNQLWAWHDTENNSGASYVMQLISVLLNPKLTEYSASFAGRLVSVFITKSVDKLSNDDIDMILRAVLSKLQRSVTLTVTQSLLLIFAHLINTRVESVISFLSQVPGPCGDSALQFVMNEWCEKQSMFFGSYDKKVSIVALTKLLQYGLTSNDERLQQINVRGEQIFSEGIRTRSKAAKEPEQWTVIPLLVKIYKLLLHELSSQLESGGKNLNFFQWEDASDSEDEEVCAEDGRQTLAELLNDNSVIGLDDDEDDYSDDEDAIHDPLNEINITDYVSSVVKEFCNTSAHGSHFVNHLNQPEKDLLVQITQS